MMQSTYTVARVGRREERTSLMVELRRPKTLRLFVNRRDRRAGLISPAANCSLDRLRQSRRTRRPGVVYRWPSAPRYFKRADRGEEVDRITRIHLRVILVRHEYFRDEQHLQHDGTRRE